MESYAPISPAFAKYILNTEGISQAQLAAEYSRLRKRPISKAAITRYIKGESKSKPFWDFFLSKFNPNDYILKAS